MCDWFLAGQPFPAFGHTRGCLAHADPYGDSSPYAIADGDCDTSSDSDSFGDAYSGSQLLFQRHDLKYGSDVR